jgi:hypothetical protein
MYELKVDARRTLRHNLSTATKAAKRHSFPYAYKLGPRSPKHEQPKKLTGQTFINHANVYANPA